MAALDGILNRLGIATTEQVREAETRAKRAYEQGFDEGFFSGNDDPVEGTTASFGYRRQTQKGRRDFAQLTHDQIINTVWTQYQSNPIAKRALALERNHIMGHNTVPVAEGDPDLQEILDAFWKTNKLQKRLKKFVISRGLFGELCLPVFIRQADGRVKLGYIDPNDIDHVVTHPRNPLEQWMVVCKERDGKREIYRIIREDEGFSRGGVMTQPRNPDKLVTHEQAVLEPWEEAFLLANALQGYTGSCFYFDKNNVANQPRGFSDLLQSADPLDQHDDTLFALGEREQFASFFSWDVAIDGSPEITEERAAEIRKRPPIGRGAINVHNNSEEWTFVHPDLKQPGTIATADAQKTHILEGVGQPRHWHGEPDGTNRATAESSDNPTNKSLEHEQGDLKDLIVEICQFVRDQAEMAGNWKPTTLEDGTLTGKIDVMLPEISHKDLTKVGTLLTQVTQSVSIQLLEGLITPETAARAVAKVYGEMGIDYNPEEELEKIAEMGGDVVDQAEEVAVTEWSNRLNGHT